jgi:hypothetical protein
MVSGQPWYNNPWRSFLKAVVAPGRGSQGAHAAWLAPCLSPLAILPVVHSQRKLEVREPTQGTEQAVTGQRYVSRSRQKLLNTHGFSPLRICYASLSRKLTGLAYVVSPGGQMEKDMEFNLLYFLPPKN